MDHQRTSAEAFTGGLRASVDAGTRQLKETNQAAMDASRAVFEAYAQGANVLHSRADWALRAGLAVAEAGMSVNRDHLSRLLEAKNPQDFVRVQMLWGANQTIAIFHELAKLGNETAGAAPSDKV